jgi:SAM-dependent methyltransferase
MGRPRSAALLVSVIMIAAHTTMAFALTPTSSRAIAARWRVSTIQSKVASKRPRPKSKTFAGACGFCAKKKPTAASKSFASALDDDAAKILAASGGDVNLAHSRFYEQELQRLQDDEPSLYNLLKADPANSISHQKLIELTWDTISAFMPKAGDELVTPTVARRLERIANAAVAQSATAQRRLVDVGCGNGLLLPYLLGASATASEYRGYDLSGRMISAASSKYSYLGASFSHLGFEEAMAANNAPEAASGGGGVDARRGIACGSSAIIFNGSLQFFADVPATLQRPQGNLRRTDGWSSLT